MERELTISYNKMWVQPFLSTKSYNWKNGIFTYTIYSNLHIVMPDINYEYFNQQKHKKIDGIPSVQLNQTRTKNIKNCIRPNCINISFDALAYYEFTSTFECHSMRYFSVYFKFSKMKWWNYFICFFIQLPY